MPSTPTSTVSPPSTTQTAPFPHLYHVPLQTRSSLGYDPNFNASAVLERRQQYQVQVIASTFSSLSILAAICALYWFCMMRRNFRRDLVLLLIIGDFWKSLWFLIFSSTTLSTGYVYTDSTFCQASGYLLQVGLEACDCAIFLMSLHMSLQIFPPVRSFLGYDGLYRIRHFVIAGWFVLPNIMSSLAFINSGPAFISQGGFCSLPIRPIWYRLALSWIPRYLIWIFVMGVAIRIYRHVGFEFKVFGQENDLSSSVGIPNGDPSAMSASRTGEAPPMPSDLSSTSDGAHAEKQPHGDDDIAPDEDSIARPSGSKGRANGFSKHGGRFSEGRRSSVPTWATPFRNHSPGHDDGSLPGALSPTSKSLPSSRRGSRQIEPGVEAEDFAPPPPPLPIDVDRRPHGSISTLASLKSSGVSFENSSPALAPITEHRTSATTTPLPVDVRENVANKAMQSRRRAIQRQLRLLFIYPTIYLILWIMPFVSHAMNYSNHFAQHPVFAVSVLNIFCQNIMGFTDVSIFCWREKPWRHIPGSDGTFFGSFMFWKFCSTHQWQDEQRRKSAAFPTGATSPTQEKKDPSETSTSTSGLLSSIKRWSMSISGKASGNSNSSLRHSNASTSGAAAAAPTTIAPRRVPIHRRTRSGGCDRRIMESERAHERLAMERADYHQYSRSVQEGRTSMPSGNHERQNFQQQTTTQTTPERKEWWDRHMSVGNIDLQFDDDGNGSSPALTPGIGTTTATSTDGSV